MKKFTSAVAALVLMICANLASADTAPLKPFVPGSYQQLLTEQAERGFMLVIWSLDCPTCIKDMELLSHIHKNRPELKIVMLSTDEPSASAEIQQLLQKYQLDGLENWVFATDNAHKLRYEIDQHWYGELPRTYFFSASHQREGVSGALSEAEYLAQFDKMHL